MDNNIVLSPIPLDSLMQSLRQVIKEEIKADLKDQLQEKLLNVSEVAKLFKVSSVTIASWVDRGLLIKYCIGGRNYFKYSEIIESLKTLKKYKAS